MLQQQMCVYLFLPSNTDRWHELAFREFYNRTLLQWDRYKSNRGFGFIWHWCMISERARICCVQGSKAAAAWGVCILLLTAKANTSPMYKSLAAQFEGKLAFGEARSSNQEIASAFGVERCAAFLIKNCICHNLHETLHHI